MTFSEWANERNRLGHDVVAIKRPPHPGETYEDGTPIKNPINAGWRDVVTGETFWFDEDGAG